MAKAVPGLSRSGPGIARRPARRPPRVKTADPPSRRERPPDRQRAARPGADGAGKGPVSERSGRRRDYHRDNSAKPAGSRRRRHRAPRPTTRMPGNCQELPQRGKDRVQQAAGRGRNDAAPGTGPGAARHRRRDGVASYLPVLIVMFPPPRSVVASASSAASFWLS
jgi:hypothetical protein